MTTRSQENENVEAQFLQLLAELLKREGYKHIEQYLTQKDQGVDFVATSPEHGKIVGEVKLYRSRQVPIAAITLAIKKLGRATSITESNHGLLVTNAALPESYIESIDFPNSAYKLWDFRKLNDMFSKYPDIHETFSLIIRETQSFSEAAILRGRDSSTGRYVDLKNARLEIKSAPSPDRQSQPPRSIEPETRGKMLAEELKTIPPGKGTFAQFEGKCAEIIEYLFKDDFTAWTNQSSTDTSLHRFDMIARNISKHDFWISLQNHFRAKYIVFEFKNYEEAITQKEIYSTEKYLYLAAMRTVAIIVSREGANDNALSAARGALREHGKIILNVSVNELCDILTKSDDGGIASDEMASKLDKMLMHIER